MQDIHSVINPKRKFYKLIVFILFFVVLLASGAYYYFLPQKERIVYDTLHPTKGDISAQISATGTLNPLNEVQIGSQVSGIISAIYVDTNDLVKKGQILAKINDQKILQELSSYEAQLQSAKAQLASLQATLKDRQWQYERLKKLYKQSKGKYPSFADVQSAQVAYEISLAEIESKKGNIAEIQSRIKGVKIDLENTIITSPIDGVVLTRSVDVGQTVAASFSAPELFKVAQNLEEMKLVVQIAESDIGKIALNQPVSFSVDAYPNRKFLAKVDKINYASTTIDNIVSYEVVMNVGNKDLLLFPGMSATAEITVASCKNALLLPVSALYFQPNLAKTHKKSPSLFSSSRFKKQSVQDENSNNQREVWVLQNNQAQKRIVKVGISNGQYIVIKEGITPSSSVIVAMREVQ